MLKCAVIAACAEVTELVAVSGRPAFSGIVEAAALPRIENRQYNPHFLKNSQGLEVRGLRDGNVCTRGA
ncbi:MAG: hypothetical protein QF715_00745 [Pseudomonadales bacterium]|jgi:hypothetical protein|nr:hypothetical protein [Pseudomonadales bacterium]MDP7313289.1 hypothetical protein [Pseudomonadales bacterium]